MSIGHFEIQKNSIKSEMDEKIKIKNRIKKSKYIDSTNKHNISSTRNINYNLLRDSPLFIKRKKDDCHWETGSSTNIIDKAVLPTFYKSIENYHDKKRNIPKDKLDFRNLIELNNDKDLESKSIRFPSIGSIKKMQNMRIIEKIN